MSSFTLYKAQKKRSNALDLLLQLLFIKVFALLECAFH